MTNKEYVKIGRWQLVKRASFAGSIKGSGMLGAVSFFFLTGNIVSVIACIVIFLLGVSYEAHLFERAIELDIPDIESGRIKSPFKQESKQT